MFSYHQIKYIILVLGEKSCSMAAKKWGISVNTVTMWRRNVMRRIRRCMRFAKILTFDTQKLLEGVAAHYHMEVSELVESINEKIDQVQEEYKDVPVKVKNAYDLLERIAQKYPSELYPEIPSWYDQPEDTQKNSEEYILSLSSDMLTPRQQNSLFLGLLDMIENRVKELKLSTNQIAYALRISEEEFNHRVKSEGQPYVEILSTIRLLSRLYLGDIIVNLPDDLQLHMSIKDK